MMNTDTRAWCCHQLLGDVGVIKTNTLSSGWAEKRCRWQWLMHYAYGLPRKHIWTCRRFVLIRPLVFTAVPSLRNMFYYQVSCVPSGWKCKELKGKEGWHMDLLSCDWISRYTVCRKGTKEKHERHNLTFPPPPLSLCLSLYLSLSMYLSIFRFQTDNFPSEPNYVGSRQPFVPR